MQEAEIDGECFIGMDLVDINGLTAKLKLRKLLRLAWDRSYGNGNCWLIEIIDFFLPCDNKCVIT